MRLIASLLLAAPLLASGAPHRSDKHYGHHDDNTTSTSCSSSPTYTSNPPTSTTSCVPTTTPTKAYTVMAGSPDSLIHHLPMQAGGLGFHLGGFTSSYCPTSVGSFCPPGNETVFLGGSIGVLVPGGQQQYTEPGGRIGYTQAHSLSMPMGSLPGGFGYFKCEGEEYGHITTSAFGATGLMACPDTSSSTTQYVVFANISEAVVPSGNVEDCIGFDGLTSDYDGVTPAAWQYS